MPIVKCLNSLNELNSLNYFMYYLDSSQCDQIVLFLKVQNIGYYNFHFTTVPVAVKKLFSNCFLPFCMT